ncbi:MAG TPA: hypothetical protein VFP55_13640 [Solirubrobacteraceae bacterium]|nr:hypothetical protein [Solirubrobacteraceae bacterium]
MSQVANIASAIVFVALIGVLVRNKNTASVITAFGNVFTQSLKVAEG